MRVDAWLVIAGALVLAPMVWAAFWAEGFARWTGRLPRTVRVAVPVLLCVAYALMAMACGMFRWGWLAVFALLPVAMAFGWIRRATRIRSNAATGAIWSCCWRWVWRSICAGWSRRGRGEGRRSTRSCCWTLGSWDLGWCAVWNGVGFDLRMRARDVRGGLREFRLCAVMAIALGLWLGFLHGHAIRPWRLRVLSASVHVPIHCDAGGAVLSWMAAESAGTTNGTDGCVAGDGDHLRDGALEQARSALQLALCAAGCDCGDVLWERVASAETLGASELTHTWVDTAWSMWLR